MTTTTEGPQPRPAHPGAVAPMPGRRVPKVLREFLEAQAAGGIVLLVAAVAALVWANSPWSASYRSLWGTEFSLNLGRFVLTEDLKHWVNDGLMAIFFFVVGLEIKRELVHGDLRDPRTAAMPAIAALGGMAVPRPAVPGRHRRQPGLPGLGHPHGQPTSLSPSAWSPYSAPGSPPRSSCSC